MMVHQKSNNGSDGTSVAGNTNPNPHFVSQEQNTNVSFYSEHNHSTLGGALSSSLLARPTQPKKTAMVNLTCPSTLFRADTGNRAWQTSITPTASTTEAEEPVVLSTVRTDTALLLPGTSTNSAYHATASLSSSSSSSSSAASSASHYRNASTSNCTSYAIMHSPIEMHVDYSALRKAFSKFQSKTKQRHDIAQQQVLPWFHKQPPCLAYPFRFSHQQGNKRPTNAHSTGKNHQQDSHTTANTAAASSTGSSFWSQKIIGYHVKEKDALSTGRIILLRWWRVLMSNAQQVPYAERCIYLECVLEIMSRAEFVEFDHSGSPSSTFDDWIAKSDDTILNEYRSLLSLTLRYAIGKLNQKAIYSNMILFCSKVLALCFFKVPGLAPALLRILPVKAQLTRRIRQELGDITADCSRYRPILSGAFSAHLHPLMVTDARSYQSAFRQAKSRLCPPITFAGNWIRRWQSDDSELFFFFYRHYHSTLKLYVKGAYPHVEQCTSIQRNALLSLSPGYMYLAAYFAGKIDALLHREIHSVTTVLHCSQQNANSAGSATNSEWHNRPATASGNKSMPNDPDMMTVVNKPLISTPTSTTTPAIIANGDNHAQHQQQRMARNPSKPRPLDAATHKYAECMAFCVTMADPQGLYYNMVNIWLRAVVKRTNFMVAESVFCLLDFIEVLILEMQCCQGNPKEGPFLDLPFLLDTLNILLTKSDHTISLLRALSFIYIHFPYLTSRTVLMETLCRQMLLSPPIFEKLLLHWNRNVRIFFLRCLFWRVARVYSPRSVRWANSDTDHDTCDGQSCRQEWQNLSSAISDVPSQPQDTLLSRSALETHILLEALLAALYLHYERSQETKGGRRQSIQTRTIHCTSSPFAPKFTTAPPMPFLSFSTPPRESRKTTTGDNGSKECYIQEQEQQGCRRRKPTMFRRKFARSAENKLLRLFAPSKQPSSQHNGYDGVSKPQISAGKEQGKKLAGRQSGAENEDHNKQSISSADSSIFLQSIQQRTPEFCAISQKPSSLPSPRHSVSEPLPPPQEDEKQHDKDEVVWAVDNWKYAPENHVYARKAVDELSTMQKECRLWSAQAASPVAIPPGVVLEWPRNWSFSSV